VTSMKKNGLEQKTLTKRAGDNKKAIAVALLFALVGVAFIWRSFAANNPNLSGDLNSDNKVTVQDLSILLSNYGKTSATADVNGDGKVDATDLPVLLANFGKTAGAGGTNPTPTPTPTPGGTPTPTPTPGGIDLGDNTTAATCPAPTPIAATGYTASGCIDFNGSLAGYSPYNGGGADTVSGGGRKTGQCKNENGMLRAVQDADGSTCGGSTNLSQKYGLWETKMKIKVNGTSGTPTHPVLLMWSDNGPWDDGEMDYFEINTGEKAAGWLHCVGHAHDNCYRIPDNDVDYSQWHVYSFEWTADKMTGYIDGKQWWSVGPDKGTFPKISFHATVQHDCIGCKIPVKPAEMDVDWMHMFKK
jgi:hypothetical protein